MSTHRLGRVVNHDPRSRAFPAPTPPKPPASVLWRVYAPALDQGDLGCCTAATASQWVNTAPAHRRRERYWTVEDAHRVYSAATKVDPFPGAWPPDDTGSSGLAVAKVLQAEGVVGTYRWAFGLDHMIGALAYGPVWVGTEWREDMFTPRTGGFVTPTGSSAGGHEYLCVGVNTRQGYLTFLNSWGPGWGVRGRFRMTLDSMRTLLAADGDVVVPERVTA